MVDAEKNILNSDVLVSNESPVKYENDVKTEGLIGICNVEDKTDDQSDSNGEDLMNARSPKSTKSVENGEWELEQNVVLENNTPTIYARTDDMVSGYLKVTYDEVHKIDEGELNVHQSEKMIYEVNQNSNNIMVDRQEDHQMKTMLQLLPLMVIDWMSFQK
ncbi:hypothetical protein RDI58_020059 [Solanum bulbocastanum]|uniref:Uncharacterized protein n=1 Tax=Solanum bulbocastanum TaxID=147425 RepID=A0AAN8YAB3_SOLBU